MFSRTKSTFNLTGFFPRIKKNAGIGIYTGKLKEISLREPARHYLTLHLVAKVHWRNFCTGLTLHYGKFDFKASKGRHISLNDHIMAICWGQG